MRGSDRLTYRLDRSWKWNYRAGPAFRGPFPRVPRAPMKDFLGIPVRARIGISAGILLNSRWIGLYARLGFDILTYKTVRSRARASYPVPNWAFLEDGARVDLRRPLETLRAGPDPPPDLSRATACVSFGMPSRAPGEWTRDVRRARALLPRGKALIVSVVASPGPGSSRDALVKEFARLAEMAASAGAQAVEANLSCPNVTTREGGVYLDPALTRKVMGEMKRAAGGLPVLAKAGAFADRRALRSYLRALDGRADAALLVNAVSRRVVDRRGRPFFGKGREVCGVIGPGIGAASHWNVRTAAELIRSDRLALKVVAGGGVLGPEDAAAYFEAGACAVVMGGGAMYDPGLAARIKKAHPEW